MNKDIKILLTADIHLGIGSSKSGIPETARVKTFKKITAIAKGYDLLLIAGDLFHGPEVDGELLDIVASEIKALKAEGTEIIFTPGRGESSIDGKTAPFINSIPFTVIFSDDTNPDPYEYRKGEQKIFLYGLPALKNNDIVAVHKNSPGGFHIGLFYVNFDINGNGTDEGAFILRKKDIKNLDLDFYALGHNHNFKMFKIGDKIIGAYPGSPEAVSEDEIGDRFVLSINIRDNHIIQIKRLSVNSMVLLETLIDCTELITPGPIKEKLEQNRSKNVIQRLVLQGSRNFVLQEDEFKQHSEFFSDFTLLDKTTPTIEALIEEYYNEKSFRGEFFRLLKERVDQTEICDAFDKQDMAISIKKLLESGFTTLEDWLCDL